MDCIVVSNDLEKAVEERKSSLEKLEDLLMHRFLGGTEGHYVTELLEQKVSVEELKAFCEESTEVHALGFTTEDALDVLLMELEKDHIYTCASNRHTFGLYLADEMTKLLNGERLMLEASRPNYQSPNPAMVLIDRQLALIEDYKTLHYHYTTVSNLLNRGWSMEKAAELAHMDKASCEKMLARGRAIIEAYSDKV